MVDKAMDDLSFSRLSTDVDGIGDKKFFEGYDRLIMTVVGLSRVSYR